MQKTSYNRLLEIACFSLESCLLAQQTGADRIEFCADYSVGGITPSKTDIIKAKETLNIPVHVIIRPRGGDFVYNEDELTQIKQDILFCKTHHIDGVVFGALTQNHQVDKAINKLLIELAGEVSTTFHRAIDECEDMDVAVNDLIGLGFSRVLTSGGKPSAVEGKEKLRSLQEKFGKKITIIPGGGIRSSNIESLINETGCFEFHSAALTNDKEKVSIEEVKNLLEKVKQF